jgi:hypothetical protein
MECSDFDTIIDKEINFLQSALGNFRIDGSYCYGNVGENYEDVIEQFLILSLTCFVMKESHFRLKGHKRFSETGK